MIFIDTNMLPRQGSLRNVLMSSVLRVAAHNGIDICISEVVLEESVSARGRAVDEATQKLREAINQASKVIALDDIYIPGREDEVARWEEELRSTFRVIPVKGDHAVEALRREAFRRRPAREGKGARDAAIWLCAIDYALEHKLPIYFVSDNTEDFADPAQTDRLHSDLLAECDELAVQVSFHRSLDSLIGSLATRVDFAPSIEALSAGAASTLLLLAIFNAHQAAETGPLARFVPSEVTEVEEVQRLKAYKVDQLTLSLVRIKLRLAVTNLDGPEREELLLQCTFKAWVESLGDDSDIIAIDIDNIGEVRVIEPAEAESEEQA